MAATRNDDSAWAKQQREAFDVPEHITYLNCGSLAPRLRAVTAAGQAALARTASPWQIHSADWFTGPSQLQASFARLIGAAPTCVALVPSVSYGIAVAAHNLPVQSGDNIVVVEHEYPSNFYSWRRLCQERGAQLRIATASVDGTLTDAIIAAIDRNTAVVATANCHWTDGTLIDLPRIGAAARQHGAAFVVDASQSLGVYPLDIAELQPDFLVTVGYKWLLGPYGLGYMYVAERWHAEGKPLEESWLNRAGSEEFSSLADYTDTYREGAQRFAHGESAQFYLVSMAIAALAQVEQWTPARIQQQLRAWTTQLAERVTSAGLTFPPAANRVGHILGLRAPGGLPANLVSLLAERDIYVGIRGNNIRVAPHLHSTATDIDRLAAALRDLIR